MSESPNNSTVLQRLLAERYLNKGYNNSDFGSPTNSKSGSHTDLTLNTISHEVTTSNSSENDNRYQPNSSQFEADQTAYFSPQDGGPAARLDALCRSTLDKPTNTHSSFLKPSGNVSNSVPNSKIEPMPCLRESVAHSASREVLSRLRKELEVSESAPRPSSNFVGAETDVGQLQIYGFGRCDPADALISPRYTSIDPYKMESRSYPLLDLKQPQKNKNQLHGHPKSNSGGDEYLYTDQLRKNAQRRGIRSKKNKVGLGRSSSLRQTPEETTQSIRFSSATCSTTNSVINKNPSALDANRKQKNVNDRRQSQAKHSSSRSAPLQNSDERPYVDQRRASLHANLHCLAEDTQSESSSFSNGQPLQNHNHIATRHTDSDMHQNHQDLNQPPSANNQAPYHRGGLPGPYPQSPFYGGISSHSMMAPNSSVPSEASGTSQHAPILNALAGNSPPRPPPPPYPGQYNEMDPSLTQKHDADAPSWAPQRPNSLALGNCSKKKSLNNSGGAQSSPCLTSPTSAKSFTPHLRGTPFYSNVKDSPYVAPNAQIYATNSNSPHQKQTSNGSNSYLRRSGSGNNVTMTSSSSGSSTCTTATTPAYQDPQLVDPGLRSPIGTARHLLHGFSQESYGSTSGVSKSDSMNSASSSTTSGSGVSRIGRRKRNSSKPGFGSGSSSSNSGSRPNSMADLADRLETENETLRNSLDVTKQKLKRFETLQVELQLITQSHQALQQTACNRERLEMEMRCQLTAELEKTKAERDQFKDQVSSLTEQLKNMSMTSSNHDANDVTRVNLTTEATQTKARKSVDREQQLEDELEEYKERVSELHVDIELLTSSLHKAQTTITVLKDKFLQNDSVDSYTEQLSKRLASLQRIVDERQDIEKELKDRLWRQLQSQRPLKSTSSNDEGISEMDPPEPSNTNVIDVYSSREGQMLGAKAEMLKWQHRYLEHGLLQHVHSNGSEATQHKRLYKALKNHRHAVSDPGFDQNPLMKTFFCETDSSTPSVPLYENASLIQSSSSLVVDSKSGSEVAELSQKNFNSVCMTSDCACQTPTSEWILGDGDGDDCDKNKKSLSKSSVSNTSASSGNVIDADSPSEGYHSQQSSGSPTPSTEKQSLHFTTSGDSATTNSQVRELHPGVFRRNRSADVLTTTEI